MLSRRGTAYSDTAYPLGSSALGEAGRITLTSRIRRFVYLFVSLFACIAVGVAGAEPVISVGPYTVPGAPGTPFVVPIQITGAADLVTWQFDLAFDPTDLQVNCDATIEPCPVTEGPFTSSGGQHLTLFIPGVVDNDLGLISLIAGAYLDIPPGPSGNGVLAFVEFVAIGEGDSTISVQNASVVGGSSAVPEPSSLTLLGGSLTLLTVARVIRSRRSR